jgi:hypothetical protein
VKKLLKMEKVGEDIEVPNIVGYELRLVKPMDILLHEGIYNVAVRERHTGYDCKEPSLLFLILKQLIIGP